jgi:hypothetical protein
VLEQSARRQARRDARRRGGRGTHRRQDREHRGQGRRQRERGQRWQQRHRRQPREHRRRGGVATGGTGSGGATGGSGGGGSAATGYLFGAHPQQYPAGAIKPAGTQAELDAAVAAAYDKWKAAYVMASCGGHVVKSGART